MIKGFNEYLNENELSKDLKNFLEKELHYKEDSHIEEKDIEQVAFAFMGKNKKYNKMLSSVEDEIKKYFYELRENLNESKTLYKIDLGGANPIEIKSIDGYEGEGISIVQEKKIGSGKSVIVIPKEYVKEVCDKISSIKLNEAKKVQLKRKYGIHPPHEVGFHAPLREKVLSTVKESEDGMTEIEIKEYISGLREESGKSGDPQWLEKNKEFFKRKGEKLILSDKGEKYLSAKKINEEKEYTAYNLALELESYVNVSDKTKDRLKEKILLLKIIKNLKLS